MLETVEVALEEHASDRGRLRSSRLLGRNHTCCLKVLLPGLLIAPPSWMLPEEAVCDCGQKA
ncbi:hypothetical protein EYF80_020041 [Liparis tanakae]|uniref:Uncharacterized protein n=1 Tax=Liparis tanakae TaxID=230148 RepID=A0A4Z2HVF5_9TELE|nr:hypothetical protein EYF80_020041 [Liparis tanakae]